MTITAIEIDSVNKTYTATKGNPVTALTGIDLTIRQGEFVTLVGPSGCGKSTLLKAIGGLIEPSSGTVAIEGAVSDGPSRSVGIVYQQPLLLPWLTVTENILLPTEIFKLPRREHRERCRELLDLVGLTGFDKSYPHQLSGGMQQRVGIARALITDPDILLMDEPFGALDAMTRDQLTMELLNIWDRFAKTIVFVTHSISESILLADRVVVMTARPGRIAGEIAVDLARPRTLTDVNTARFGELSEQVRTMLDQQHDEKDR